MSKVLVFVLDFEKYEYQKMSDWLSDRCDLSKFKNKEKICSQFIRYFVFEKFLNINKPLFFTHNSKPYLKNKEVFFNISHTGKKVIMVVFENEIGVDAETISYKRDVLKIAERYFSSTEFGSLCSRADLHRSFYTLWTLKEAEVKRSSLGIAKGLRDAIFRCHHTEWLSESAPNDFCTFFYNELIISICSNDIKQKQFEFFEIIDFKFNKIEL